MKFLWFGSGKKGFFRKTISIRKLLWTIIATSAIGCGILIGTNAILTSTAISFTVYAILIVLAKIWGGTLLIGVGYMMLMEIYPEW